MGTIAGSVHRMNMGGLVQEWEARRVSLAARVMMKGVAERNVGGLVAGFSEARQGVWRTERRAVTGRNMTPKEHGGPG